MKGLDGNFITVQEAAKIASCTEGYIRRVLAKDGFKDLKLGTDYQKLGKVWVINKNSWFKHLQNLNNKYKRAE